MKHLISTLSLFFALCLYYLPAQTILYPPDTSYTFLYGNLIETKGDYLFVEGDLQINSDHKAVVFVYRLKDTLATLVDTFYDQEYDLQIWSAYGPYCAVSAQSGLQATGSVFIYHLEKGKWKFAQKIEASDGSGANGFGNVKIYKDEMIVGANGDNTNGINSGAAYIFTLQNGVWKEVKKLKPVDLVAGDRFGRAVSIYKNTAIVAAGNVFLNGKVYVYRNTDTGWSLIQKITHPYTGSNDGFGNAIGISNGFTLIGAVFGDGQWMDQGLVYTYTNTDTGLINEQIIAPSDLFQTEEFGNRLEVSDPDIIIGAWEKNNSRGKVYIYKRTGNGFNQTGALYPKDNLHPYRFGNGVSLEGNLVVVSTAPVGNQHWALKNVYIFQLCAFPAISFTESNPVCPGDSVHLQAGCPKDSVNWFNPNGLLLANSHHYNFIATGNDTVWAEIWANGVFTGYAGADTVIVQAGPQPDFQTDSVCSNQITHFTDLSFTGTAVTRYFWDFDNDGITDDTLPGSTTHTYTAPGFYQAKLKIINSYGCADSLVKTVWVKNCTGIEERHAIASLTIAPNPNRGTFLLTIRVNEPTTAQIQLTDLSGKLVLTRKVTLGSGIRTLWIDAGRPAPGVYFLSMQTGREVMNRKVVLY